MVATYPGGSAANDAICDDRSSQVAPTTDSASASESYNGSTAEPVPVSSPPTSMDNDVDEEMKERTQKSPSFDEQMDLVKNMTDSVDQREGLKGFIISCKWLNRIQSRTSNGKNENHPKSLREGDVGPIDNRDVLFSGLPDTLRNLRDGAGHEFIPMKPGLRMDDDYEIIPQTVWEHLVQWYGTAPGSPVITRFMHDTSPEDATTANFQFEVYPPIFTIQKLRGERQEPGLETVRDVDISAPQVVASRSEKYQDFLKRIKTATGINTTTKVQVWKVVDTLQANTSRAGIPTPMSSRSTSPAPQAALFPQLKLTVDLSTLEAMTEGTQRELLDIKDETANDKYNGHLNLGAVGFPETQTLILEEQIRDEFATERAREKGSKPGSISTTSSQARSAPPGVKSNLSSRLDKRSPTPSGVTTRGRLNKKTKARGTVGLQNLGNSCYMNSALQCIRGVEELTMYFQEELYKEELNVDNPLGHKGAIARAYASLLHAIYTSAQSFSPRVFKSTLGRSQPLFSGYGQQDSQEFMGFLIDGLHEDLNRVHKKPYIENPDSDDKTVHDPEAIRRLGETFRENHRKRNDSVAMDLFSGFYKNTMVCPDCEKVSITFDPFAQVTLQLPIENTWQHQVTFVPLHDSPVLINVDIDKNTSIRGLKQYVAKRIANTNADHLVVAEEYGERLYKVFENAEVLSEANIQPNDKICVYELHDSPTNWPPVDKKKSRANRGLSFFTSNNEPDLPDMSSHFADRMAVPLIHRYKSGSKVQFPLLPAFVLITREEAKDFDRIQRKVLQKVETLTTRPMFADAMDPETDDGSSEPKEQTEDSAPAEGSTVQAHSVDDDDDLVDVSMVDKQDNPADNSPEASGDLISLQRTSKSKVLDPTFFIEPEFRQLFEIMVHFSTTELIPPSFTSVNESSKLAPLESRLPSPPQRKGSSSSWTSRNSSRWGRDSSHSSEDELAGEHGSGFGMNDATGNNSQEDSDEDKASTGHNSTRHSQAIQPKTKNKKFGFTRQAKKPFVKSKSKARPEQTYLLRLGEGLVLEWNDNGMDQLFGADWSEDFRGERTDLKLVTVSDPELDARKARRAERKKSGVTLAECFEETSKSEVLSEENEWFCNRCKQLRRATKTLELWTVPDILIVHLKRFSAQSRLRDKVDVFVDFPVEGLDLSGRVGLPEDKTLVYDLFAVDNHYGGLGGGHYTAYVKSFDDKKWYDYNDSIVSAMSPESTVTRAAYLLFYRRRSKTSLGPSYLHNVVNRSKSPRSRSSSRSGEGKQGSDSPSAELAESCHISDDNAARHQTSFNNDQPPLYGSQEYDEGISMEGPDNPMHSIEGYDESHGQDSGRLQEPSWNFRKLDGTIAPASSDRGNDSDAANSDCAAPPSEDEHDRVEMDFGEDDNRFDESRMDPSLTGHEGQLDFGTHIEQVPMIPQEDEDDGPVAEVRISDEEGA